MDKLITTVLLIIASVTCTIVVINAAYPAFNRGASAMVSIAEKANDRVQSSIEVIQAADDGSEVYIWVKNVGSSEIAAVDQSDVFFGETGSIARIPYGEGTPHWTYEIENNSEWLPMATVKVTIHLSSAPSSGTYFVNIVIPNGISDEYSFSI